MNPVESFALFLEVSGPGGEDRALRLCIPGDAIERIKNAWSSRVHVIGTNRSVIEGALGTPDIAREHAIYYRTPYQQDLLFAFEFNGAQQLLDSGYRRMVPMVERVELPRSAEERSGALRQMSALRATTEDVARWFGPPVETYGWWPIEVWSYGDGFEIEFRLSVVEPS